MAGILEFLSPFIFEKAPPSETSEPMSDDFEFRTTDELELVWEPDFELDDCPPLAELEEELIGSKAYMAFMDIQPQNVDALTATPTRLYLQRRVPQETPNTSFITSETEVPVNPTEMPTQPIIPIEASAAPTSHGLSSATLAAISVGAILLAAFLGVGAVFLFRRQRRSVRRREQIAVPKLQLKNMDAISVHGSEHDGGDEEDAVSIAESLDVAPPDRAYGQGPVHSTHSFETATTSRMHSRPMAPDTTWASWRPPAESAHHPYGQYR